MSWSVTSSRAPIRRWWGTLAFRLTTGYAISGLLTVFFATAGLYVVLVTELERSTDLFLADKLNVLRTILRERSNDTDALREEVELESAARRYEHFYIRLLDEQGNALMATPGMAEQVDLPQFVTQTHNRSDRAIPMKGKQGQAFRIASAAVPVGSPQTQTDIIQIAVDVSQKEELLARYRRWFVAIMLGTLIIFPVAGYTIARRGIRPVEEMATTARHIGSTNLHERILPEGYPVELASLADTFNKMMDGLEESFERISRFSADIAHDLRTPVNNIRGEAEVALARARTVDEYRDVLESCLEEAVRLSDLIGNLLFLARAENPLTHLHRIPVDVSELLVSVREYYEASAAEGGISLTTAVGAEPVIAELDRPLIQRAVSNLVANAMAHTPPGGAVVLGANAEPAGICIDVSDTGVGIPPEALPRVFDRFYRVDTSRSQASGGTGLGLSIVQSIMTLHGGHAEIASQPGQGTRVTLHIPAS
jgi:two-component system, OmpR family, heavy metal sensor histidine kinase CusS